MLQSWRTLHQRAAQQAAVSMQQQASAAAVLLRDLHVLVRVRGADTVPVPGNTTAFNQQHRTDTGALAYRLGKPLSCRLLPMTGLRAGDMTTVTPEQNPYLTNTCVFNIM